MTCEVFNINLNQVKLKNNRNKSEASHLVKLPSIKVETDNELVLMRKVNNQILKKRRMGRVRTLNEKGPIKIMDLTDKVFKDIPKFVSQVPVVTPKVKSKLVPIIDSPVSDETCRIIARYYRTLNKNQKKKKNEENTVVGKVKKLSRLSKDSENSLEYIQEYRNKKLKNSFTKAISPWVYQDTIKHSVFV